MIEDVDDLRARLGRPHDSVRAKAVGEIDAGIERLLAVCPFVVLGTASADGSPNVTPRGGPAGFVRVLSPTRIAWGELPGNRLLYAVQDLATNPKAHVLVLVPGLNETLRVEGNGFMTEDPEIRERVAIDGRIPWGAFVLDVERAMLHCGKALLRSGLWQPDTWPTEVPKAGPILAAHIKAPGPDGDLDAVDAEGVEANLQDSYRRRLW